VSEFVRYSNCTFVRTTKHASGVSFKISCDLWNSCISNAPWRCVRENVSALKITKRTEGRRRLRRSSMRRRRNFRVSNDFISYLFICKILHVKYYAHNAHENFSIFKEIFLKFLIFMVIKYKYIIFLLDTCVKELIESLMCVTIISQIIILNATITSYVFCMFADQHVNFLLLRIMLVSRFNLFYFNIMRRIFYISK